jgi:hypothetical protein
MSISEKKGVGGALCATNSPEVYSSKFQYSLTTGLLKLTRFSQLVSLNPAF